jgi:MerR family transcriptional regulator, light-induced transcriptional regulator
MDRLTQDGSAALHAQRESWGQHATQANSSATIRADGGSPDRMAWLVRTIEAEIIPRLMLAHRSGSAAVDPELTASIAPGADDVIELARIVLDQEAAVALRFIGAFVAEGVALDTLYLNLLAPAARHLGDMWEADLCDFTQVTVGLWRLQQVMYDLSPSFQNDAEYAARSRRAMLVPAPGSQHTLGLFMVAEFFRRAGWDVWGEPSASASDLLEAVRGEWFDVIGISIGAEFQIEGLSSVILGLKRASRNPAVRVMLGGPVASSNPDLHTRLGADATAFDANQALTLAESLLGPALRRC